MGPPEREKPAPSQGRPSLNCTYTDHSNHPARQMHARRGASWRLPPVAGRSDPWWYGPDERGYAAAAAHLLELGLTPAPNPPAMRSMWRHRGESQRLAWVISERWDLVRD